MPIGKGRSSRRSSSTSKPVVTTIAFVALCVLGVWLLSSTPIAPPKSTTKTNSSVASSIINFRKTTSHGQKSPPAFEDLLGDLPGDGGKFDQDNEIGIGNLPGELSKDTNEKDVVTENEHTDEEMVVQENVSVKDQELSEGKKTVEEQEKQKETITQKKETEPAKDNADTSGKLVSESEKMEENTNNQKGGVEEHGLEETKVHDSQTNNQENPEDNKNLISDEDQQKRLEQHQQQEETTNDQKGGVEEHVLEETKVQDSQTNNEDLISDEDQQKRLQQHQQQEDDQMENGQPQNEIHETNKESKAAWLTQADQSVNQKGRRKAGSDDQGIISKGQNWKLCNVTAGSDYIPCLDNEEALAKIRGRQHYEHRERHCPSDPPTCLVPLPQGYKKPIQWPKSRDKIWYSNVPHTLLAEVKGHQNWVKVSGEFLTFPGGGTQFIHGALHYIDFVQQALPDIAWGKRTRVVLDVGCGVASLGGYLFERDVLTMSFAPKDEHEAQVQFALERGIPAISAVMGTQRLPFPSGVFDVVHCARCRVPWHVDGGTLLLELNRVLRPGGYFVWSATPVYQKLEEDVQIWKEMSALTVSMCWELVTIKKDALNSIGAAIYHKPDTNDCYEQRKHNQPPMCKDDDAPDASWYVPLQPCMHRVPSKEKERGTKWPLEWPERLQTPPYWLNRSQIGVYGRPAPDDFASDHKHWKHVVRKTYMSGLGINWSNVRNIMDMRAVYGGFAAALKDLKVWVLNVVNIDSPDTLPIIFERGLFGIYHDWCESFSTYPRTYDLLHADHLFSRLKKGCNITAVVVEVDRIVRPGGKLIVQDDSGTIREIEDLLKSLHWEVRMTFSQNQDGMLSAQKSFWRPESSVAST